MQNQIIPIQPNNAQSKRAQNSTTLLDLRYHAHSADRLRELYDAGELTPSEVRAEISNAPKYYNQPASFDWIVEAYRKMVASHPIASKPTAEQAHVIGQFANDLISENITPAEIDYAFTVWRKSPEQFAPKQGNVLDILRNAGFARPSQIRCELYVERLRALIDPEFKPRERQAFKGIRTQPKEPANKPASVDERQALVARMNAKYGGKVK